MTKANTTLLWKHMNRFQDAIHGLNLQMKKRKMRWLTNYKVRMELMIKMWTSEKEGLWLYQTLIWKKK